MNKISLRLIVIFTLLLFSWTTLTAQSFTGTDNDVLLQKAEKLFNKKKFSKAVDVLLFFIKENGKNWSKDLETATAYYMLANIYFKNNKTDPKTKVLLRNVLRLNINYKANSPDVEFNKYFETVKKETLINNKKLKEKIKRDENKRVIKKKKFPVLLVAGGVVVLAIAVYLLTKKYDSGSDVLANEVYNSIEWATVPKGEFTMGDDSVGVFSKAHTVYLDTYKIAINEITFEQYDKFCEDTKRDKPSDWSFGRGNRPVIDVDWDDANDFCKWLSDKTGKTVKLPTEAQWEKAARGTDERYYPWGNNYSSDNCNHNPSNITSGTVPVGSFPSGVSPYGVNDMAGNVSEWCSDWYGNSYYANSPRENPQGPDSGTSKIEKGGNWRIPFKYLQSAQRRALRPSDQFYYLGFRVVTQ